MSEYFRIIQGDSLTRLRELGTESIQLAVTSPPYYQMRDYKIEVKIGWESTVLEYVNKLADIFDEINRVLTKSGSLWVNIADKIKGKTLLRVPEKLCIELERRGWYSPQTVIWKKSNAMPPGGGNAAVRFTIDYEMFYHFSKTRDYYFQQQYEPMKEDSLRESKYHSNPENRKSQEYRQSLMKYLPEGIESSPVNDAFPVHTIDNWNDRKEYDTPRQQKPLDIKKNIINKQQFHKFGGNNADKYGPGKYSGNEWNPNVIQPQGVELANAIKLGYDPNTNYAEWYFTIREKKGYHNHENDDEMGYSHQGRGQGKVKLAYPYGSIKRAVWDIPHAIYPDAHFATFPPELVETPIKSCSRPGDIVLDPFCGSATVGEVCMKLARNFIGIELSEEYVKLARNRLEVYNEFRRVV